MYRQPHIPLFLWIATALVVHAIWGGGATEVSRALEETLDIRDFARDVGRHVRLHATPVEVALLDESDEQLTVERIPEADTDADDPDEEPTEVDPDEAEPSDPERPDETEKKKPVPEETPLEKKEEKPEDEKKKEDEKKEDPVELEKLKVPNRIAVDQHVENQDQEDNPDAQYIGDHANHVEQETRARITSTDQNDPNPTPGGNFAGTQSNPGNSEEERVAQSDDAEGAPDRPPGDSTGSVPRPSVNTPPPKMASQNPASPSANARNPGQRAIPAPQQPPAPAQPARPAQPNQTARAAMPEVHQGPGGSFTIRPPQEAREARKALPALPERKPRRVTDMLGLGAAGRTKNGVNLNLTPDMAVAAVGADQLQRERSLDGERRRSAHRGSWKSLGLERWRSALENYVATVQPGNQTALNSARVPFARYLNGIHLRLHPVFADRFLSSLDALPSDHPLNREEMSTHLEIVLSKQDGSVVRMGITKSSGVTAFDVGALDSVQRAAPFGPPPEVIVSPDGNVYLHWEFHRRPYYACSTYFARPYLLKSAPESAPPRVDPPRERPYDEEKEGRQGRRESPRKSPTRDERDSRPDERSGSRERGNREEQRG